MPRLPVLLVLLLADFGYRVSAQSYTFYTLAGNTAAGSIDGTGGAARFNNPLGVAVDRNGVVYVADTNNHTIRKISADGVVTTLAGSAGSAGSADGPGSVARFDTPYGVAVGTTGNVFVADLGNRTIRKITPDGVVATLAGRAGGGGLINGVGGEAMFLAPCGVTVDASGNVFVADSDDAIRKISADGVVTTLPAWSGRLRTVEGVAVNGDGDVFFPEYTASEICVITAGGVFKILTGLPSSRGLGGYADGVGSEAHFNNPCGVATDGSGNVFVADTNNQAIRKMDASITVTTLAIGFGSADGARGVARFSYPHGVAVDADGNVFVADSGNNIIRKGVPSSKAVVVTSLSQGQANVGGSVIFAVTTVGAAPITYQWRKNGSAIVSATNATLTPSNVQPTDAGLYSAQIATSTGTTTSDPALLGVSTTSKVIGAGEELQPTDIHHPNGNVFDQVLLEGAAETITADANQITRTSYVDLNDDIVQVEFSGAGTLSLVLDNPSGPALPLNYNQAVTYVKGHAAIVITGANETTNVSVFTVGRVTAVDPTGAFNVLLPIGPTNNPANNGSPLFQGHAATTYDGVADIAFIAISSTNGKFGSLHASNASCFATKGLTGVYAPEVAFAGPVYLGDINASDAATPTFIIGSSPDTRITGGSLLQTNGQPVKVSGLTQLKFTAGVTSNNVSLPARSNKAILEQNGTDVTAQIVVNP